MSETKKWSYTEKWLYTFMFLSYFQFYWSLLVWIITMGSPGIWINIQRRARPVRGGGDGGGGGDDDIILVDYGNDDINGSVFKLNRTSLNYFKNPLEFTNPPAPTDFNWRNINNLNAAFNPMYMWKTQIFNLILNIFMLIAIVKLKSKSSTKVFSINLIVILLMILGNLVTFYLVYNGCYLMIRWIKLYI